MCSDWDGRGDRRWRGSGDERPDAEFVVYLVGHEFATTGNEAQAWVTNTLLLVHICRGHAGRPLGTPSTRLIFDLSPIRPGGSTEPVSTEPRAEYTNPAVTRERVLQWASQRCFTPVCQMPLFYASKAATGDQDTPDGDLGWKRAVDRGGAQAQLRNSPA